MMKRRIFFWLERLKITPAERKTISGLLILLVTLTVFNLGLSQSVPFEEDQYRELEQQFEKRTAMLEAEEQELMAQYYPSEKKTVAAAVSDTVTDDSTDSKQSQKKSQKASKERININTADKSALESLPGIGATYAKRIIKYRKENGKFETIDELKKINGIAQKRLDNLKPFIKLKDPK